MREIDKDNLLRSWKEIAAYLGCDVRTCHRWEGQRGMPVHRAEGAERKSPVFAYKDELDAWFRGTFRSANGHGDRAQVEKHARPWLKWALGGAAGVVLGAAFLLETGFLAKRQPADFAIDGSFLVVLDKHKQELWRWDIGMEDLEKEKLYREHFQVRDHDAGNILPALVIKDIDGDGDREVLFAPKRVTDQTGEGRLHCFDRKGHERWSFAAGRELRCGGVVYSPDYRIAGFHAHDLDGDGRREVLVEAFHAPDWPCQLTLLDCSGKRLGEYWNAGYLRDVEYLDLNGDGVEEIIVVGVNKEYRGGCLVVLDPRRMAGGSPQTGAFACEGLEPGTELYYLVTAPSDVAEALGPYSADLRMLEITKNSRIRATSSLGLYYEFDFELRPLQVAAGDGYKTRHGELSAQGKIASVLDEAYLHNLLGGIRWWNGSVFTAEPSANAAAPSAKPR